MNRVSTLARAAVVADDFLISGPAGEIPVRLYTSAPREGLPVVVYYHGGGFCHGDLDFYDPMLRALTRRAECLVLSVAYRLAPRYPYPAGLDDACAALDWVADHAHAIGADPGRLAVAGDSAGGCLAACVAQYAKSKGRGLALQVLLYPNTDATLSSASWEQFGSGSYLLSRAQMLRLFNAYLPEGVDRRDPRVSPLYAEDFTALASALVITAEFDPLRDEGRAYAAKLEAAGVAVDYTCWRGAMHGFAAPADGAEPPVLLVEQVAEALYKAWAPA